MIGGRKGGADRHQSVCSILSTHGASHWMDWTLEKIVFYSDFHVDLTLALTRCSCSALREVAVFLRECGKCKPLYASVIERCVTLPVGTWSVARKQSFASTAVTCTMSQLRTSSYNRDGSEKVRTFVKRTHRHKPFDLQRFVSVLWFRHAQLRDLVEV